MTEGSGAKLTTRLIIEVLKNYWLFLKSLWLLVLLNLCFTTVLNAFIQILRVRGKSRDYGQI